MVYQSKTLLYSMVNRLDRIREAKNAVSKPFGTEMEVVNSYRKGNWSMRKLMASDMLVKGDAHGSRG